MYYKVTSTNLMSTNNLLDERIRAQYKIGKIVKPKYDYMPLAVFNNLSSAMTFNSDWVNGRIFECYIKPSDKKWGCFNTSTLNAMIDGKPSLTNGTAWMNGAVLADEVMLTKEILPKRQPRLYYKVVCTNLKSCNASSRIHDLAIQYKIGEWVVPQYEIAPAMVFSTLNAARNFAMPISESIYSCEIVQSKRKWQYIDLSRFEEVRLLKQSKKSWRSYVIDCFPKYTVLADAVKLIEVV